MHLMVYIDAFTQSANLKQESDISANYYVQKLTRICTNCEQLTMSDDVNPLGR